MYRGYVKLWRKSLDTRAHGTDMALFGFWCHLMLSVNHKSGWFMGQEILPGQIATSYGSLSDATGLSVKVCRNYLEKLQVFDMIKHESRANRFSVISICNWVTYQHTMPNDGQTEGTTEGITVGTTTGKPRANQGQQSKNDKNDDNDKKDTPPCFNKPENKAVKTYDVLHPAYRLAMFLWESIEAEKTAQKKPDYNIWAAEFKKIHDIDGHIWAWLLCVLKRSRKDDFWKKNLRSPKTFREQLKKGNLDKFLPTDDDEIDDDETTIRKITERYGSNG